MIKEQDFICFLTYDSDLANYKMTRIDSHTRTRAGWLLSFFPFARFLPFKDVIYRETDYLALITPLVDSIDGIPRQDCLSIVIY